MPSPASSNTVPATRQTSRNRCDVKPFRFSKTGATVLAALILAGSGAAQTEDYGLGGDLDLAPSLEDTQLFNGILSGRSGPSKVSVVNQQGSGNSASITQTGTGSSAIAVIAQSGVGNVVDLTQCNCGNFAGVLQDGTGNLSEISQSGGGNVFLHQQYGDGLSLSVAQYGGAQISITQTGP